MTLLDRVVDSIAKVKEVLHGLVKINLRGGLVP